MKIDEASFSAGGRHVPSLATYRWYLSTWLLHLALMVAPASPAKTLLEQKLREMKLRVLVSNALRDAVANPGGRKRD